MRRLPQPAGQDGEAGTRALFRDPTGVACVGVVLPARKNRLSVKVARSAPRSSTIVWRGRRRISTNLGAAAGGWVAGADARFWRDVLEGYDFLPEWNG